MSTDTLDGPENSFLENYILVYNEKSASFKVAKKKWKHKLTNSFHLPLPNLSEDWIKEQSPKGLIAMGGDGTVNSVANIILRSGLDIPLCVIPGGGGNDISKRLTNSLHTGPEGSAYSDIFELDYSNSTQKKYAVNTVEWGIGAIVAARRENNEGRFLLGLPKYIYLVIKSLFDFNSWKATICIDGKYLEFNNLSAVIAGFGSSTMGGGSILFPDEISSPNKDKSYVLVAEGFSRFKALGLILKFIRAKQFENPRVQYYPFTTLELIPRDRKTIMLTIDGELSPAPPVTITVSHKQLKTFSAT